MAMVLLDPYLGCAAIQLPPHFNAVLLIAPIRHACLAMLAGWKMRLGIRKLRTRQPEVNSIHLHSLSKEVIHSANWMPTIYCKSDTHSGDVISAD